MTEPETELVTGTVDVQVTGIGSKSEMPSVVLLVDDAEDDTSDAVLPLRRREATALSAEPELAAYAGRHVRVSGSRLWTTFVVDTIEVLDELTPG